MSLPPLTRSPGQPPRQLPPGPPVRQPPTASGFIPEKLGKAISMIVYGPSGFGKTSFVANFPNPGFLIDSQERGVEYLVQAKLIPTPKFIEVFDNNWRSWEKLLTRIYRAASDSIDTLVIESLTGFESICFMALCRDKFSTAEYPDGDFTDKGFFSFQKGPKLAARFEFPRFMEAINTVLDTGKNVIITGHSSEKQETSPQGTVYQRNVPIGEKEVWARVARWSSIVAFLGAEVDQDLEKSRGSLKKVAKSNMDRLLYVSATPYCEAKNWWGLPHSISAGTSGKQCYENFWRAISKPR